jgi:serine/threonine protein kinase
VEAALDHYDCVVGTNNSLFVDHSNRCLRALNKPPLPKPKIKLDPTPELPKSLPEVDIFDVIARLEVAPIRSNRTDDKIRFLGRGGFGEVRCEKDPKNPETQIAVKKIPRSADSASFVREVETLEKLRHPCVVAIHGWSRTSKSFEIHLQFAVNGALSDHLELGNRAYLRVLGDATRQARLISDIVLGMKYVHSRGIIHRDLKPANILINERWRGLLCDFGLSRARSAKGLPTEDPATTSYAAPEEGKPNGRYTEKVDVFTFGLVAYAIVSRSPVSNEIVRHALDHPHPRFGDVIPPLIRRCWSVNPTERPSFQGIFDKFKSIGWAILPDADASIIEQSVLEVIRLEGFMGQ